jgi:hypothetical protein
VSFGPYLNMMNEQFGNQFLLTFLAKPETKAGTESVKIASEIRSVDFLVADDLCVSASFTLTPIGASSAISPVKSRRFFGVWLLRGFSTCRKKRDYTSRTRYRSCPRSH